MRNFGAGNCQKLLLESPSANGKGWVLHPPQFEYFGQKSCIQMPVLYAHSDFSRFVSDRLCEQEQNWGQYL